MIRDGKIAQVVIIQEAVGTKPALAMPNVSNGWKGFVPIVDGHGCIVMPCFVDAHTHLVKTHSVPRVVNRSGTMSEAVDREMTEEEKRWKDDTDVYRRMEFAIQSALHYGTKAIRTHLDGCASTDPQVQEAVYQAFSELQQKYKGHLILQGVANLWLPLWLDTDFATKHANKAAQYPNVVLGAYVGNPLPTEHAQALAALDALLAQAHRLQLDVDLHIDESNDPKCCGLTLLCQSLARARQSGYQGRVVLGHCCALSLQTPQRQAEICRELARLGKVCVVANPTTNLSLQDRRGSVAPLSSPIPADVPRTPQWRGVTLLQELRAAGVTVAAATDNVRDHWYPYGSYDLLSTWSLVVQLGHLDTAPTAGHWADVVHQAPSEAMGLDNNDSELSSIASGNSADFIIFPKARRISELLSHSQTNRIIIRRGKVTLFPLPDVSILDDLVS